MRDKRDRAHLTGLPIAPRFDRSVFNCKVFDRCAVQIAEDTALRDLIAEAEGLDITDKEPALVNAMIDAQ